MAFNENDRNRRGFNQQPNDRDERNRNYGGMNDYDRSRERNYGEGGYGSSEYDTNRGFGGSRGDSNFQGNRGDNRYQGGYSGMGEGNRGSRGYGDQDYGYGSPGYDYDRDRGRGDYGYQGNRGGYSGMGEGNRGYDRDYDRGRDFWDKTRDLFDKTKDEVSSWFGDEETQRRRRMDEMRGDYRGGQHRGKGPRGYTRSDERIREDIHDRLSEDPHVDASDIDVSVNSCEVTLTGTVNSRWEKRHAEDIVESVSGVKHVENRLRVGAATGASAADATTLSAGTTGTGTAGITGATTAGTAETTRVTSLGAK